MRALCLAEQKKKKTRFSIDIEIIRKSWNNKKKKKKKKKNWLDGENWFTDIN